MSTVVSNWHISNGELHFWTMLPKHVNPPKGATKGRDVHGKEGWFVGDHIKIASWQEYTGNMWRFVGTNGKVYLAAMSTHYANRDYPAQCIRSKQELLDKLNALPK